MGTLFDLTLAALVALFCVGCALAFVGLVLLLVSAARTCHEPENDAATVPFKVMVAGLSVVFTVFVSALAILTPLMEQVA